MTPSARLSAAIDILDRVLAGSVAEQMLTNWGRASRYAGSGDRAAVRDLVFDALRCRRSFAALGGEGGRGLILGGVRAAGQDATALFTGEGHAPAPLTAEEAAPRVPPSELEALDCPNWLAPRLRDSLGERFVPVMQALRHRAPVFLRVNTARISVRDAQQRLAADGISAEPHLLADTALQVTVGARKVHSSAAYAEGLVELQDAASQAVIAALPLADTQRVLDYCAGGGGKTLAMAARAKLTLYAHDADPARMRDLPVRAERAGTKVTILGSADVGRRAPFDLVLADVPCSGSGSWRRAPEAKWTLTEERLQALCATQAEILERVAPLVAETGFLAYATCSLLADENERQIDAFLRRTPGWERLQQRHFTPLDEGDGFFVCVLARIGRA